MPLLANTPPILPPFWTGFMAMVRPVGTGLLLRLTD
jgi:hypothetical protein